MPRRAKKPATRKTPRAKGGAGKKLSLKRYAEHRGVSAAAVRRALDEGRLTEGSARKGANGRWTIDVARADAEWSANTSTRFLPHGQRPAAPAPTEARLAEQAIRFGAGAIPLDEEGRPLTKVEVETIRLAVQAQLDQLKLEELRRALVRSEDVDRAQRELGARVKDAILSVPARVASRLARITDEAEVEIVLERALTEALLALVGGGSTR